MENSNLKCKFPFTSLEQDAIQRELAQILSHPSFKNSERCSKFLQYLALNALQGNEQLKERKIGQEVFGRSSGYETHSDPVVRNAASDTRKRLIQYYSLVEKTEVRINLASGSYSLEFASVLVSSANQPVEPRQPLTQPALDSGPGMLSVKPEKDLRVKLRKLDSFLYGCVGSLIIILGALLANKALGYRANIASSDRFWSPVVNSEKEVLMSVGSDQYGHETVATYQSPSFALVDANAYAKIASVVTRYGKRFHLELANQTQFSEMRDRSVILIGGYKNPWTLRLANDVRYRLVSEDVPGGLRKSWIEDSLHPNVHAWETEWVKTEPNSSPEQFAVISRVMDPNTGGIVVSITGLGRLGTEAAGEYLTNRSYTDALPEKLLNPRTNIELVIRTHIVDGVNGPPTLVTFYVW